jgi:hypothetical protein
MVEHRALSGAIRRPDKLRALHGVSRLGIGQEPWVEQWFGD